MLHIQCNQCGKWSVFDASAGADPDSALECGCCTLPHHHGQAANECPGAGANHAGAACPEDDPKTCTALTPPGEDCPGEHCGLGVDGCTVCRPITITLLGGVVVS